MRSVTRWIAATVLAAAMVACGGGEKGTSGGTTSANKSAASGADITGADSTFAAPIYQKWAADYATKTGVKINYQSIGSGAGIKQLQEMTVDFGGTDAPMTDQQMTDAKGGPIVHIPTVLGGVSITYNLSGVTQPLRFTGPILAKIYLGKITKWNDPNVAAINKGVTLPAQDIVVVHRSEGSGTSYIFTDYLSATSPDWQSGPGKGTQVNWPVGLGGKGSEGVSGQVKQTPGAIGYVELAYAQTNHLPSAEIQNAEGEWMAPTQASVTAAAAGAATSLPANTDYRVSIVNAKGKGAYPISSFTWMILYRNQKDAAKGKKLVDFIRWGIHDGEASAAPLGYAPLPASVVTLLDKTLDSVVPAGK